MAVIDRGNLVLILSWSATGQSRAVATDLDSALTSRGLVVSHKDMTGGAVVKFTFNRFFGLFAPVVRGQLPPEMGAWVFDPSRDKKPSSIVFVWPVWFLSVPAFVMQSLLNIASAWGSMPVTTVMTCRRAWISAAVNWRGAQKTHGMRFLGITVLREPKPGLVSFFLTPLRILWGNADVATTRGPNQHIRLIVAQLTGHLPWNEQAAEFALQTSFDLDALSKVEPWVRGWFERYAAFFTEKKYLNDLQPDKNVGAVNAVTMMFILVLGLSAHLMQVFHALSARFKKSPRHREVAQ